MKKSFLIAIIALAASVLCLVRAQNPYMPLWEFIPDGEPYVFEDPDNPGKFRVYVYGSHDMLRQFYCGRDQVVWSAPVDDLTDWRLDGVIFESKTDANGNLLNDEGLGDVLYAPDVAEVKGKDGRKTYYLYPNVQSNERANLVARSDRPDGPFVVCNWSKDDPRKTVGPFAFDPAAFMDDDGRAYGYWGFETSYCAELDPETMATVKPGTKIVEHMIPGARENARERFFEASSIRKIKDKYVFIYSRTTLPGEEGIAACNYTLAYCWSNSPMGPWTYGGTIIDGRGKEKRPDGTTAITATPFGNTHGSICEINGKWWVFYHRQAGTCEYSRQAMVAPIDVEVREGPEGYVRISEAEFTSEGFTVEGLDPFRRYSAGIACYLTGPEPATQDYPNVIYTGSHSRTIYDQYDGEGDIYDLKYNRCPMVNNTSGSVFGYKYFNFSKTYGKKGLKLVLNILNEGVGGRIDIYVDRPSEADGGVRIGSLKLRAKAEAGSRDFKVKVRKLSAFNGKHSLFLVFDSPVKGKSICEVNELCFVK